MYLQEKFPSPDGKKDPKYALEMFHRDLQCSLISSLKNIIPADLWNSTIDKYFLNDLNVSGITTLSVDPSQEIEIKAVDYIQDEKAEVLPLEDLTQMKHFLTEFRQEVREAVDKEFELSIEPSPQEISGSAGPKYALSSPKTSFGCFLQ